MKKIIKILLLASLILGMFTLSACNKEFKQYEYTIENNEIVIKSFNDLSSETTANIPDEIEGLPVVKIANFGIVDTTYITKIVISKNIREIEPMALKNNVSLKTFEVDPENKFFKVVDGVLYSFDGKTLISHPILNNAKERVVKDKKEWHIASYKVLNGTETIYPYAFYHNYYIEEIILPDSVKTIGESAFFINSDRLKKINFSKNLEFIGKDAFALNRGLTEITIYENIKKIDAYVFFNCVSLTKINICRAEEGLQLGEKWYSTDQGKKIKALKINFNFVI